MKSEGILNVGEGFGVKADEKAATVYVYGEPERIYYRGRLKVSEVYDDLVECFYKKEPYAEKKTLRHLAVLVAGNRGLCGISLAHRGLQQIQRRSSRTESR